MALITTPGAADADALISLAYFQAWAEAMGYDLVATSDAKIEQAIRRASTFMNTTIPWKGAKANGRGQPQAFPRLYVLDAAGVAVDHLTIPAEVERATAVAAYYELLNPGGLSPIVNMTQRVKSKSIGPLRKEYFDAPNTPSAARPVLMGVYDLIAELVTQNTNPLAGSAVRS